MAVVDYLLKKISVNRVKDMWDDIYRVTELLYAKAPSLRPIIEDKTGIIIPEIEEKSEIQNS